MTPEQWQRIQVILDRALLEPPEGRHAAIAEACGGDAHLEAEVLALLDAAEAEDTLLDQSRISLPTGPKPEIELGHVGSYELIRRLGRGGMGEVFLARRTDDVHHKEVAVKLLQVGLESGEMVRRFLREREILAQLEHPHIARLLDGGTTGDGRPYLVMEYVVGTPIDQHCQERGLSLVDRLVLFEKVCKAIHFAHQNLVVHRDLKPGNILVTAEGEPKLLDFGIAKLLDTESFPLTLETTATGRSPMTPAYASPEQLLGERVTTASDVYSLGVLLYVMLTGQKPHGSKSRTPLEHLKVLSGDEPAKPSASATDLRWGRQLNGDLDKVVLMALRREPERRYSSAEQFAQDLERYRASKPVIARRDTFTYRAGKFIERHRLAVGSTALALVVLVSFLITLLAQKREIVAQRDSLRVTSDFLISLFENPDPTRARGTDLSARELLDRGAQDIERRLAGRPGPQADLMTVMGRSFHALGLFSEAERVYRSALEIRRRLHPGDDAKVAEGLMRVAGVVSDQGNLDEAETLAGDSLAMHRRLFGEPHAALVESLFVLGVVKRRQGRLGAAEALLLQAREMAPAAGMELRAKLLHELGTVYRQLAKFEPSEALFREALALLESELGSEHLRVAEVMTSLATVFDLQGQSEEAERHFRRALEIQRAVLVEPHPLLIDSEGDLAKALHAQGRYAEAEQSFRSALEMARQVYGEAHTTEAALLAKLAGVVEDLGRPSEAESLARRALEIRRRRLGDLHRDTAVSCDYLAQILTNPDIGKLEEAAGLYEEALRIFRHAFGGDHPLTATSLANLASLLTRRGDTEGALSRYRESLEILRRVKGEDHDDVVRTTFNLAFMLHRAGDLTAAAEHYGNAEAAARRVLLEDHSLLGVILTHFGRLKGEMGELLEAESKLLEARTVLAASFSEGHGRRLTADLIFSQILIELDRLQEAAELLQPQFEVFLEDLGADSRKTRRVGERLIEIYDQAGQPSRAALVRQALES